MTALENTYNMSVADNIFYAKRNLVDSIWKEARVEGISVTFPETKEIFEGRAVSGLSVDDTVAINNLKRAWEFVLDTLDADVDLAWVRQLNGIVGAGIVADAGQLRMSDVSIGGTEWRPDLPDYDTAREMLSEMAAVQPGELRALKTFSSLCRAQLFYDGNKRTAQLAANKVLISTGAGILAVPPSEQAEFTAKLVGFYESDDDAKLVSFLHERCIDGTDFGKQNA